MSLTSTPEGGCTVYNKSLTRSHSFCDRLPLANDSMAPKKKLRRSLSINSTNDNTDKMSNMDCYADNDFCDSDFIGDTLDDCEQTYRQYRYECQQLIRSSKQMSQEQYIALLEQVVNNLLDQNQCLVRNIAEIQHESTKRVLEMNSKLQSSAARTEEVMLSLQSHELLLKSFVTDHCCCCCGCDQRLLEFKVCHGSQCNYSNSDCQQNHGSTRRCWSYDHQWSSILGGICNKPNNTCLSKNCVHNLPSEIRFTTLVDNIDIKIHALEAENEELKKENLLIRELNSLLSFRKELPVTIENVESEHSMTSNKYPIVTTKSISLEDDCLYLSPLFEQSKPTNEEFGFTDDLHAFLSDFPKNDMSPNYLASLNRDNLDSCDESRTDSLNDRLDSGCSTDAIPSQTDLHSLMLSDFEEDSFEDVIKHTVNSITLQVKECDSVSHRSDNSELNYVDVLRHKLNLAERLVPKLYSKLFFYLTQRNMLLKQFQLESRARKFCKQELSSLTDCLVYSLKGIEMNAKAIKKKQTST